MKYDIAKLVVECGQNYGHDLKLYTEYSGRFMYSNTTIAIEYSKINDLIAAFVLAATESEYKDDDNFVGDLLAAVNNLRFDNLGLKYIAY